jgi:catechol-2,3-dioxygenase
LNFHVLRITVSVEHSTTQGAPVPVQRLNHAVLYVRDVDRSVTFYTDALGFRVVAGMPGRAAFLQAEGSSNDHDLGLFAMGDRAGDTQAGRSTVGLYHLAWEVDTLAELRRIAGVLSEHGSLVGASDHGTTKALYAHDPDGLEFEVSWLVPADRLPAEPEMTTAPLDIEAEIARYGADTAGGVGVSFAAR